MPLLPTGSHIDVITTQPNRYHSFAAASPQVYRQPGLSIFRANLPRHESGMLDQSRAFLAYSRAALQRVSSNEYDIVVATSSRLMTAVLGAWIARRKQAKLYLDIRDIFVDTIKDVLPSKIASLLRPIFSALERFAIKRADKINLVSRGFQHYFAERYPKQRFSFFTNGVDDDFINAAVSKSAAVNKDERQLIVLYAGNLGEGQGLHAIVPALANRMRSRVCFKIIGDGGRKKELAAELSKLDISNVELLPPVNRNELLRAYSEADVLFLHLNNHDAFKKVLPSKVFEYAALGKPLWAGVSGYPAEFIKSEVRNSAVFPPCDVELAVRSFETLNIEDTLRDEFISKYSRAAISAAMAADIIETAQEPS